MIVVVGEQDDATTIIDLNSLVDASFEDPLVVL